VRRVFIPNRGEIAVRIVRACHRLGLEAVVGHSVVDRNSLAVRLADDSVCIGESKSKDSYLSVERVISAAVSFGCDAIHPGYGFLSESAELANACADNDIIFVGPSASVMTAMSDKSEARDIAKRSGMPVLSGTGPLESLDDIDLETLTFPVLIKAVGGGGGRGIRLARDVETLITQFEEGSREARSAFGDARLYLEHYIERARHLEVQVLADRSGNVVYLGERECSVQRRHQKVLEEAPAVIDPELRQAICDHAVALASFIHYENAGTVEYVYDCDTGKPWFIEMNTRLQVEHGVTEMTTGIDIVAEQLSIAAGNDLSFDQDDVEVVGHAIEWRVTAEDVSRDFMPFPGTITEWHEPVLPGIRIDTHCFTGYTVPPHYDSLLGKLMAFGGTRERAIERLSGAATKFRVEGVPTTLDLCVEVVNSEQFKSSEVTTHWLGELLAVD
jgi:acetyl-CoA carboxylase biotin carboxylase subunit